MALIDELTSSGNWLFKRRSYLPLLIFPLLVFGLTQKDSLVLDWNNYLLISGLIISMFGQVIRILTVGFVSSSTSGRNTKSQIADSLNTTGIYSLMRHPLYFGNFFMYLGPFIFTGTWWIILIFVLSFWIYYERIMLAEEDFLCNKFNNEYLEWSETTPAFFPSFRKFKKPAIDFSLGQVFMREYTGVFAVFVVFIMLIALQNYLFKISPILSIKWISIFVFNLLLYLILRYIKKYKMAKLRE